MIKLLIIICISCISLLGLNSCGSTKPTNYYLLKALHTNANCRSFSPHHLPISKPKLGISPVVIADYLQRQSMIVMRNGYQAKAADFHYWGEDLASNISNVLVENLSSLLHSNSIFAFPEYRKYGIKRQLRINVLHFDILNFKTSKLVVKWQLLSASGKILVNRRSVYYAKLAKKDYAYAAVAMSKNLYGFSKEIAREYFKNY